VEGAQEWVCMIKGKAVDYKKIEAIIKKNHSYEVPEILAFPILEGNRDYLKWIDAETSKKS
jgi:periplasmic divalent cation tolerance protein